MFALYNKKSKQKLVHPSTQMFEFDTKEEAEQMLGDIETALKDMGMGHLCEDIIVVQSNLSNLP